MAAVLQKVIRGMIPKGERISPDELEAFTQLCLMSVAALGDENPRKIMERISDPLLAHMAARTDEEKKNIAVANMCQLALVEWCRRNGHLDGDWVWRWEGVSSGRASFRSKISADDAMQALLKSRKT